MKQADWVTLKLWMLLWSTNHIMVLTYYISLSPDICMDVPVYLQKQVIDTKMHSASHKLVARNILICVWRHVMSLNSTNVGHEKC